MSQKWNLQDIKPTDSGVPKRRAPQRRVSTPTPPPTPSTPARDPRTTPIAKLNNGSQWGGKVKLIVGIVVIVGIGFVASGFFSGADLTVYPKYRNTSVQTTVTAYAEPAGNELSYELLVLEANGERQVTATGEETVSERAVGSISIYNEYSTAPQRLIKNTRFESPDGHIYRIEESVEVPGTSKDEDGGLVPGVVTAKVFADGTGEAYNIDPATFTIPGLVGSEQFEKMYAKSTVAFTGGFDGVRYVVEDTERMAAQESLHTELKEALLKKLDEERPLGFVVYPDAATFTFNPLPTTEYDETLVTVKERGRMEVPLFKESEFAAFLAKNTVPGYEDDEAVYLTDYAKLQFDYQSTGTTTTETTTAISFNLSGNIEIVWDFDAHRLRKDVVGLSKTAIPSVLTGYPAIERAEAVIKPFWANTFPDTEDDIRIHTVISDQAE